MFTLSSRYAIGYAHFRMAGGWLSALIAAAAYLALVGGFIGLTVYISTATATPVRGLWDLWATLLLIFQGVILVVFGTFRITNCIRRDLSTQMIESHRLMPVTAPHAVLDYLVLTNLQVLVVAAANGLLGLAVALASGVSATNYCVGQIVLLFFAFFVWNFAALLTFLMRYSAFVIAGAVVVGFCSSVLMFAYIALPAIALLCSPLAGETIFSLSHGGYSIRWIYPVAIGAQVAFSALFFHGTCRRYRGTHRTTFHRVPAVLLLVLWSVVSVIGTIGWEELRLPMFRGAAFDQQLFAWQVLGSLVAAMLLAALPLATLIAGLEPGRRSRIYTGVYLLAVTVAVTLVYAAHGYAKPLEIARLGAVLSTAASHTLTLFLLLLIVQRLSTLYAWLIGLLILLGIWFTPLIAQALYLSILSYQGQEPHFSTLGTLSPIGLLANALVVDRPVTPLFGLLTQWLIVVVLALFAVPRKRKMSVPPVLPRTEALYASAE
jgi:hypothetical protein